MKINRFKNHDSGFKPRSVDGFIPSGPRLGENGQAVSGAASQNPLQAQRNLGQAVTRQTIDGFQPQQRIDQLPVMQPYGGTAAAIATEDVKDKPRKEKRQRKIHYGKIFKRTALVGSLAVLVFGGYFAVHLFMKTKNVLKGGSKGAAALNSQVKPELLKGEGSGRVNILLLGIGGGTHPGADLTDSIMLVSIDPVAKGASLLSIPRDLYVTVPDYWTMKINGAYSSAKERALQKKGTSEDDAKRAGLAKLDEVFETYLGVPVHYNVIVNFDAFKQSVDAVGGIDINVPEALYDGEIAWENGNNPLIAAAGQQHMNGPKALLYARSRYSSSDFARGQRQRDILVALKSKVLQLGTFSNPVTVSKLIDAVGNNVFTDLSLNEIMRIYDITKSIPTDGIGSIGLTDEPNVLVTTANVNGQSVVVPRAGQTNFTAIQSYVRNSLLDGFIKSEKAGIAVLNGSGIAGEATKKTDELKSYGYNVIAVGDAPTSDYTSTVLIDFTNGQKKYTKHYLEQRLGVTAVTSKVGIDRTAYGNADFVVIVGNNEKTTNP